MFCLFVSKSETVNSVSLKSSNEEFGERVDSLIEDEAQAYPCLRECYSERWISETQFISKARQRKLIKSLCRKLGVSNIKAIRRINDRLDIPKRGAVSIRGIDGYVKKRTETEIQTLSEKDP